MRAATTTIALTLCDIDTPIWFDRTAREAAAYLAFHCGAPVVEAPGLARFGFVADPAAAPPLGEFELGTDEYPERSATIIIQVRALYGGTGRRLTGPGIRGETRLSVEGLPDRFWAEREALIELFPRGVDVFLITGEQFASLPRTTRAAS